MENDWVKKGEETGEGMRQSHDLGSQDLCKCEQEGCELHVAVFKSVVCLNCGYFGCREELISLLKLLSVAAYFVCLRWSRDRSLISMTLGVCVCVFVRGHMFFMCVHILCIHILWVCVCVYTCFCVHTDISSMVGMPRMPLL